MVPLIEQAVVRGILILLLLQSLVGATERIETPQELVSAFYENLLSEKEPAELPNLFAEPATMASALMFPDEESPADEAQATEQVWRYLRSHKRLFLFDGVEPSQTLKKTRLNYVFIAFADPSTFFDGILCAEVSGVLSSRNNSGIYKQVRFPLKRDESATGPRYLIRESMITINGVLIQPLRLDTMECESAGMVVV
jgi:hypothetical protein